VIVEYGSVPGFIEKDGYGPGGTNPPKALEDWCRGGGKYVEET
jgi:hypothetical protein